MGTATTPSSPSPLVPPPPPRVPTDAPTVPPPGYTQRTPDGTWWGWDGRRWVPLPTRRPGARLAKAGVLAGVIELCLTPFALIGMADITTSGGNLGVGDALLALVITAPAIVLGISALAARPDGRDQGEAIGAIIMGSVCALLLLAVVAMG
jgi:hypothetical protein